MLTARRTQAAERDLRDIAFHVAFNEHRPATADIVDELIVQADNQSIVEVIADGYFLPELWR